jgi:thiamine biosynthesis lipoprotein
VSQGGVVNTARDRDPPRWLRRARPLLGTLVEVGVWGGDDQFARWPDAAFAAIEAVQARLSRFEPSSDIARFNALPANAELAVHAHTVAVLRAASDLGLASEGVFDVSLGSASDGWRLWGDRLCKLDVRCTLDLGGIAKGYAVDCAVRELRAHGACSGWVNAGGDLRAFGDARLALRLRDERSGGVRDAGTLQDGAFATSHFSAHSRSRLRHDGSAIAERHVSVAAAECLWADALTKIVAASGDPTHPLLARCQARAWLH